MSSRKSVYQLTDLKIGEVSLVDHAANKRRFVIVKREEIMPEQPVPAGEQAEADAALSQTTEDAGEASSLSSAPPSSEKVRSDDLLRHALDVLQTTVAALTDVKAVLPKAANDDVETVATLKKRLMHLEKQLGMPASQSVEALSNARVHPWPFDINSKGEAR